MTDRLYVVCRGSGEGEGNARLFCDGRQIGPERAHALIRGDRTPFDYGYVGAGPRVLALAILLDAVCNAEFAFDNHEAFAIEYLNTSRATCYEIHLTRIAICEWVKARVGGSAS